MEWFNKYIKQLPQIDLVQGYDLENVYITSDFHLFHKNIIKYTGRKFDFSEDGLAKMNEQIFKKINSLPDECILWILGDFAFGRKVGRKLIEGAVLEIKKKRTLCLILGNHDKQSDKRPFNTYIKYYTSLGFSQVYNTPHLWKKYIVSHEPIYIEYGSGYKNIHGHTHHRFVTSDYFLGEYNHVYPKKEVNDNDYINISLDGNDFKIMKLKDILQ